LAFDHFKNRHLLQPIGFYQRRKDRGLENAEADPKPDGDHDQAQVKRDTPAPGQKPVAGNGAERQHRKVRQEQPGRAAELRPRGDEAAMLVGSRPLHREQHRTAPFAADPDALYQAQHHQNNGGPEADLIVGWHQTHRECRKAGQQQGCDQRRLAADAVVVMAEDRGADRPRNEADEIDAERLEGADQWFRSREEELGEHNARDLPIEQEILPLDRGADRARDRRPPQLRAVIGLGERANCGIGSRHRAVLPCGSCL
jgi:hypothetical protein